MSQNDLSRQNPPEFQVQSNLSKPLSKKVLVTGGGGFLGSYIVRELLKSGYEVISFSRGDYPEISKLGARCVRGDLSSRSDLRSALLGVDAVIHTAAKAGIWGRYEDFYAANVTGTIHLVEVMKELGIKYLVYTSSPSIVFDGRSIDGADESISLARRDLAHYPATKKIAESFILSACSQDFFAVSLRPHLIWGPHDPHFFPRLKQRSLSGKLRRVGAGKNLVDVIYVENAAIAHRQALESLTSRPEISGSSYFLGQENPVSCWSFISDLVNVAGGKPISKSVPLWLAFALGSVLEFFYAALRIYQKEPLMTRLLALQMARSHYFSHKKAENELGYRPLISYEEGMRRLKTWADTQA